MYFDQRFDEKFKKKRQQQFSQQFSTNYELGIFQKGIYFKECTIMIWGYIFRKKVFKTYYDFEFCVNEGENYNCYLANILSLIFFQPMFHRLAKFS